jgi:hypothetical protein
VKVLLFIPLACGIYGLYSSYINKGYFELFLSIFGVTLVIYFAIASWKLKLILTNEGIRIKAWGYIWQEFLKWEKIKIIDSTYGAYSAPYYILVPEEGRAMYLAGIKNMNKLLFEISQYAPNVKLHPKVRKKVEKAKNMNKLII